MPSEALAMLMAAHPGTLPFEIAENCTIPNGAVLPSQGLMNAVFPVE
jgi:hypothetical protein